MPISISRHRAASAFALASLVLASVAVTARSAPQEDRLLPLAIKAWEKAPDFQLLSSEEKPVRLSDYSGHNVLIDFYRGYW